jgi:hypothetical protein
MYAVLAACSLKQAAVLKCKSVEDGAAQLPSEAAYPADAQYGKAPEIGVAVPVVIATAMPGASYTNTPIARPTACLLCVNRPYMSNTT